MQTYITAIFTHIVAKLCYVLLKLQLMLKG